MIVLLNVLLIGGLIFCLFASIYLEWAMVFDGGFQIVPFLGIIVALIGHCVFLMVAGILEDTDKDSGKIFAYSILISCAIFGLIESMFYRDTFIGEDGFGGVLAIILPAQLTKCAIGCFIGLYYRTSIESKMEQQLSEIRLHYQSQIDVLDAMNKKIAAKKENDVSIDNLMNLFCALDCREMKQLYRESSAKQNRKLTEQLQKMAANVQMNIIHTDMTVPEIATVIQTQRMETQSKIQHYDRNNFDLSDRWMVARDYKRIAK